MLPTERHLALLRAAVQDSDGLLPCPDRLVGAARRRMAERLRASGLIEFVPADEGQQVWFRVEKGRPMTLRITATGRSLITEAVETNVAQPAVPESVLSTTPVQIGPSPRPGTRRALFLALLGHEGGTTMAALTEATGWQPHSVRAALTRLRQDGVAIDRGPGEDGTRYRVAFDSAPAAPAEAGADA